MKKKQINESQNIPSKLEWIPFWGWILIFLLPLILSEYMFYMVKRWFSIVAFPIAWIAFWLVMMYRSNWKILKRRVKINFGKRKSPFSN